MSTQEELDWLRSELREALRPYCGDRVDHMVDRAYPANIRDLLRHLEEARVETDRIRGDLDTWWDFLHTLNGKVPGELLAPFYARAEAVRRGVSP